MRERNRNPITYLIDLPIRLNVMRLYRRMRICGYAVRKAGKMECRIRSRSAFKKPGGRRPIFKRRRSGA